MSWKGQILTKLGHCGLTSPGCPGDVSEHHLCGICIDHLKFHASSKMHLAAASVAGILACGDDNGIIWVYNLSSIISKPNAVCPNMLAPSRVSIAIISVFQSSLLSRCHFYVHALISHILLDMIDHKIGNEWWWQKIVKAR